MGAIAPEVWKESNIDSRDGVRAVQECKLHRQFENSQALVDIEVVISRIEQNAQNPIAKIDNLKLFGVRKYSC